MGHARTILSHTRSNLVAYIALFFKVSGSAAYAAAGGLLVYSEDIVGGPQLSPWLPAMSTGTRPEAAAIFNRTADLLANADQPLIADLQGGSP